MTTIAIDTEKLRQLEEDTRQAWAAYSERLRGVSAEQYELVESTSWEQLQLELGRLEERRRALERSSHH
jgi:hypothetical protein